VSLGGRDLDKLVAELTLEEKCLLTGGSGLWTTAAVERLGIPSVRASDGPNGARGPFLPSEGCSTSACAPCGSALGATWDPDLVEEVGAMLGQEARSKACRVLLAPTVNIHRSPLAGRNFECYSEDPLLAGRAAAAFVRGVQAQGVATTVKHFAGNEAEFERSTINSVIDERALREIYLLPFELAVREGGALGVMTAYNRLNGSYCAEHEQLIGVILRGEWGFDGFVVSDWFAVGSTAGSARAGLDLEMPGPPRFYGGHLAAAVGAGEVDEEQVDVIVRRLLTVFDRVGAFDDDPQEQPASVDRPDHRALARRAAAEAMVLLTNDGVLPLEPASLSRLALIGPGADRPQIMGGGSANFRPHYRTSPLQALRDRLGPGVEIRHERGCDIDRAAPTVYASQLTAPDGTPGLGVEVFRGTGWEGPAVQRLHLPDSRILFFADPPGIRGEPFSLRGAATFVPDETGTHTFTLAQAGRARLRLDGAVLLDGFSDPPPRGADLFGMMSREISATAELVAGTGHDLVIEFSSEGSVFARGVSIGCRRPLSPDLMDRAVQAAADCDVAVVVVGTNADWESEGHDRRDMDLPGAQDELVRRVMAANPATVVVLNTGAPVSMDWAGDAAAVIQAWFGGQEMAGALVDVLLGQVEPGGRLPTTFPVRLEHNPSYGNFPGENGAVRYGEGVLVGYRWYEARGLPVRFAFGHGLSYTSFSIGEPVLSAAELSPGGTVTITVPVTNTGSRPGAEVVQCYVAPTAPALARPPKELKAFAKARLGPGETTTVTLELGPRAFACWDPGNPDLAELEERLASFPVMRAPQHGKQPGWRIDPGRYELHVGRSSADIAHVLPIVIRV